jgi:hemerythrin
MVFFTWAEGFSVGVPEMDEQHKVLIDMINAIHSSRTEQMASETVQRMSDYAVGHFKREVDLLRGIHYRDLPHQLVEHRTFLEKTREFSAQNLADPLVRDQLASYLRNWLSHHILEVDMKYKQAFLKEGA